MRVCLKHFKSATDTLKSLKTGEEFDLCPTCEQELREIIYAAATPEQPAESRTDGPRRSPGRPKK